MAGENPNSANYTTQQQTDFAKMMAEYLAKKKPDNAITDKTAMIPGYWKLGLADSIDQLNMGRYLNKFFQADKTAAGQMTNPSYQAPEQNATLGSMLAKQFGNAFGSLKNSVMGNGSSNSPSTSSIETGSTPNKDYQGGDPDAMAEPEISPNEVGPTGPSYIDRVKMSENEPLFKGTTKYDKATWDYAQHTNGFGTKAKYPGETIDVNEANRRFDSEWQKAEASVDKFKPDLPPGVRAALTSLTFNAGEKWQSEGLGKAVQNGDMEDAKRRFVQYIKAGGKDNGALIKRRASEVGWFDEDKATPSKLGGPEAPAGENSPTATQSPLKAGLSDINAAEKDEVTGGQGGVAPTADKLAQANGIPGLTSTPVDTPNKSPVQNVPGGYSGVVPPAGPLESREQLDARLRWASPEKRQQILDEYMKRAQGEQYKTQGGGTLVVKPTPGGGQPNVAHIPGADIPMTIGGMGLHLRQNPKGGFDVIMPGGENRHVNSLEELNKLDAELKGQHQSITDTFKVQNENVNNTITKAEGVSSAKQTLNSIRTNILSEKNISFGPQAPWVLEAKRVLNNYFPNLAKDVAAADNIDKLNVLLAREATNLFTSRGTNFDLQTFIGANPGLRNSREGSLAMIDILEQELDQQARLGKTANKFRGKDPAEWQEYKQEFYDNNPILVPGRDPDTGQKIKVVGKKFNSPGEVLLWARDNPNYEGRGYKFITDDGKYRNMP